MLRLGNPRLIRFLLALFVAAFFLVWGEREASADVSTRYDYEIFILRLNNGGDDINGLAEVCRWWYLIWEAGSWSLYPIVPIGWLQTYSCESMPVFGNSAPEIQ